jgi:hypothetical protein
MSKNGDRRIDEDTFTPQIYIAGVWCSLELLQDSKALNRVDLHEELRHVFGDRWDEAKEYLEING